MTRAQQLALLVTAVILALVAVSGGGRIWGGLGDVRTDRSAAPLGSTQRLEASIRQGFGTLRVETIDSGNAYEAALTHNAGVRVRTQYANGDLRIRDDRPSLGGGRYTNNWVIGITQRVPVDVKVTMGAGRGTFDLTGLSGKVEIRSGAGEVRVDFREGSGALDRLELQAGAGRFEAAGLGNAHVRRIEARAGVGEFRLDFSGSARDLTDVEINGGVGRIVITVPEGLGVRVTARGGVTSRLILAGFQQRGDDTYVNVAWDRSSAKVEIRARLGVGEFQVRGP